MCETGTGPFNERRWSIAVLSGHGGMRGVASAGTEPDRVLWERTPVFLVPR